MTTRMVRAAILMAAFMVSPLAAYGTDYFVNGNADSSGDGESWEEAYRTIGEAIASVGSGETIFVAGAEWPNPPIKYKESFTLPDSVKLLGGFLPVGIPNEGLRDPSRYITIISGDLDGDDTETLNPDGTIYLNNRDDNHGTLVTVSDDALPLTEMSGFVLEGGAGHAIVNGTNSRCLFDRLVIRHNGQSDETTAPLYDGSGFLNSNGAYPDIKNCLFYRNVAKNGGAFANADDAAFSISRCQFIGNQARGNQESLGGSGGAILTTATVADAGNTPEIRLSIFRDNRAFLISNTGGGGGAIELGHGDLFVRASHFIENQAEKHGGAIQISVSRLSLEIAGFVGNEAGGNGGAIESDKGCSFYSVNCLFADNSAGSEGGAAHLQRAASVDICNATVSDNTAGNYGGFFVESSEAGCEIPLSIHVLNSIFWGNICLNTPACDEYSRELALSMTGTTPHDILVEYTDLFDLSNAPYPGGSNIDADPEFIDPSNRNWRLQVTSACIDAANGEVIPQDNDDADSDLKTLCDGCAEEDNGEHLPDLDLGRRIIEVHPLTATGLPPTDECPLECYKVPEMGCYERIACIDSEDCATPGDLNGDAVVNGLDVQPFTWCAVYQSQAELPCLCGDFSGPAGFPDSVVDVYDIPCFIE